jgi:hypothetical protein
MKLFGVEFLRRFAMHILPYRFVKIRYYGILGSRQKKAVKPLLLRNRKPKKEAEAERVETKMERIIRLTGFDPAAAHSAKKEPCTPSRHCQESRHLPYSFQTQKPLTDAPFPDARRKAG